MGHGAVWALDSRWPDWIVGLALSALFLRSASRVLRSALSELRISGDYGGDSTGRNRSKRRESIVTGGAETQLTQRELS
jgi:Co/Zn/Cd efflux system component